MHLFPRMESQTKYGLLSGKTSRIGSSVKHVFAVSPDIEMGRSQDLAYIIEDGERGLKLLVTVPKLYVWSLLVIEL
ncbi:glycoside hydrolase family 66 protein [Paenibacillus sp. V4I7]|uniref:glycoside hydrolase family 66 protein n=1 Tax=Paenibacillus sp. V4I7 TaxID=3042307 RepID=UPI0027D80F76|nr:glycoside hydrolase family 66 protein [Paenibacillus sp. V4I7]